VGRSPKLYAVSDSELSLTIPPRRYDFVGEVLLEALENSGDQTAATSIMNVAAARGKAAGEDVRRSKRLGRVGPERALAAAEEFLTREGFDPYRVSPRIVVFGNCPFRGLAQKWPKTVCELNRRYLDSFLEGIGTDQVTAVLQRRPGVCCVELHAK
jgi:predicted ArsR family transcriptional regulator